MIDREGNNLIETRTGSQGGSGGEKEIIASYVLTASLSYALCPDGSSRPLFGTIVLDEAFSRSSHAVAGRIIAALRSSACTLSSSPPTRKCACCATIRVRQSSFIGAAWNPVWFP